MYQHIPIDQVDRLPKWRQPKTLLYLMAIAMPLTFAVWSALLNNFVVEVAKFDGSDIGWLHTVREIPGFLAVGVIALIIFIREQVLGLVSLALWGGKRDYRMVPILHGAFDHHNAEFHRISLLRNSEPIASVAVVKKGRGPTFLGQTFGGGICGDIGGLWADRIGWKALDLSYNFVYLISGGATVAISIFCLIAYPQFEAPTHSANKWFCANAIGYIMHCNSWRGRGVKSFWCLRAL